MTCNRLNGSIYLFIFKTKYKSIWSKYGHKTKRQKSIPKSNKYLIHRYIILVSSWFYFALLLLLASSASLKCSKMVSDRFVSLCYQKSSKLWNQLILADFRMFDFATPLSWFVVLLFYLHNLLYSLFSFDLLQTKAHLDVLADALLRWARGRY